MRERSETEHLNLKLHDKVNNGDFDSVLELLLLGADVNHKDVVGDTPLLEAAWIGEPELVRLLLERGADVNVVGSQSKTALDVALETTNENSRALGHQKVVQIILSFINQQ